MRSGAFLLGIGSRYPIGWTAQAARLAPGRPRRFARSPAHVTIGVP
jgi:hypothetical protein